VAGTSGDGSGLGLAIVKEIIDRHGGSVSIAARESGDGARIVVSFRKVASPLEKRPPRS
jgi:nitrogen fixation/metabolism regulation signal transduction histidine kinase